MLYDNNSLKNQQLELDEAALKELVKGIESIENKADGLYGFILSVEGNEVVDGVIHRITKLADREGEGKTGKWTLHTIRIDFESVEGVQYNVYLTEFAGANKLGSTLARICRTVLGKETFAAVSKQMTNLCLETLIDRMNYLIDFVEGKLHYVNATVIGEMTEKKVVTVSGTVVKKYVNPKVYTFGYRKPVESAEAGKGEEI